MPDIESARGYLAAARRDAQALAHMFDEHAFPLEIFGFHVQQAIEKGLKSWLCLRDVHSISWMSLWIAHTGQRKSRHFLPM